MEAENKEKTNTKESCCRGSASCKSRFCSPCLMIWGVFAVVLLATWVFGK